MIIVRCYQQFDACCKTTSFKIFRYAVGAMESNKVVFLMDKSGTLVGEPVKLMREMAINIIKTMISDEDYISVLTFNEVVEPLGNDQ